MRDIGIAGIGWRCCLWAILLAGILYGAAGFTPWSAELRAMTALVVGFAAPLLLVFSVFAYGVRPLFREGPESIRISLVQIWANKIRSALTALGVIIGIVAVTLMGTAIMGIDAGVESSLAGFGDDVLYVTKRPWRGVSD